MHSAEAAAAAALWPACAWLRWLLASPTAAVPATAAAAAVLFAVRLLLFAPLSRRAEELLQRFLLRADVPVAGLTVHDPSIWLEWLNHGLLAVGESFVAGQWETDDLDALVGGMIRLPGPARRELFGNLSAQLTALAGRMMGYQSADVYRCLLPLPGSMQQQELDAAFFGAWLDSRLHHANALWASEDSDESLDDAAEAHLAALVDLAAVTAATTTLLDIAAGWGAFPVFVAQRQPGLRVTGIVHSDRLTSARRAADAAGVADRVTFIACRYASGEHGRRAYDRVVCSSMLPARSALELSDCVRAVHGNLAEGGLAVLHTLAAGTATPSNLQLWTQRYALLHTVFRAPSQLAELAEGLLVVESLRTLHPRHLTRTLREWGRRFALARDGINAPPSALRVWEFHFATAVEAAAARRMVSLHMVLSRPPVLCAPPASPLR